MSNYTAKTTPSFDSDYKKINKNFELVRRLKKKMPEILENPYHYKPLRNVLKNYRRTHIGSFVLIFEINESNKTVAFNKFRHHDDAYDE